MGIIIGAKILSDGSPRMNSLTTTNTTTTTLTSSGTGTGYVIQRVSYPVAMTSTVVLNSICTAQTVLFLQPVGWNIATVATGGALTGSCVPYPSIGCCTAGSFTLSSGSAAGSVLPIDVMLVNY